MYLYRGQMWCLATMVLLTCRNKLLAFGLRMPVRMSTSVAAAATTKMESGGRPSAAGLSVELRSMSEQPDVVKAHLAARGSEDDAVVDRLGELWAERSDLSRKRDSALSERKKASAEVGKLMKTDPEAAEEVKKRAVASGDEATGYERELESTEAEIRLLLSKVPNFLDDRTPQGSSEEDNVVVSEWGEPLLGDNFKWHDEIAEPWLESGPKMSGARFSVLKGPLAKLERALAAFFLDLAVDEGYRECRVPLVVGRTALEGTGQLPKFEEDLFKLEGFRVGGTDDAFLIPTAEVPLTNLVAGQLLDEKDLPLRLTAWTPCFRAEAGSYGRDVRGLIRQHQFDKVELVTVCTAQQAVEEHEKITLLAEECLKKLELPYRKALLCSGDIGFSAQICYDLEVWLPGQQAYREISSCSLVGDFQARRMGTRYRPLPPPSTTTEEDAPTKNKKKPQKLKPVYATTMNGSALAVGRALVAVLENYQQPDGSVAIPEALKPYMNGLDKITPP